MEKDMSAPPPPGFAPAGGYPPQHPPPYYPQAPPPGNVVIMGAPAFGSEPQRMTCPHCHNDIATSIETSANTKTHMFALLLCIFGLWCCAPCPYCIDSCMTKKHYCPSCKAFLGESDS